MTRSRHIDGRRRFPATGAGLLAPPVIWALLFVALYSIQGAHCAGAFGGATLGNIPLAGVAMLVIAGLACIAIAGVGWGAWRQHGRIGNDHREVDEPWKQKPKIERFLLIGVMLNAALFLVASLWVSVPLAFVEPC